MKTILIVDDEFGFADIVSDLLIDDGFQVLSADDGLEALDVLTGETPDLILRDFMMPRLGGAGVLAAMAADPRLRDIPVIVMSALDESSIAGRCTGYVAYLAKPFRAAKLLEVVRRTLGPNATTH